MMNERKRKMLETALVLFSKKGYNSTSIQEITETWGISKGAFYNNFSSKDELLLNIMKYYEEHAFKQIQAVPRSESEKETFIEQIRIQFSIVEMHKEFIGMRLTEQPQKVSDEIRHYLFKARVKMFNWYSTRLLKVFGRPIENYVPDCVILLLSMIHGYTSLMIIDHKPLNFEKTARFIVNRLESMVLQFGDEPPLLTKQLMKDYLQPDEAGDPVVHKINALRDTVADGAEDLLSCLDALKTEFAGSVPRAYMAESLLLYLKKHSRAEWKEEILVLEDLIQHYFRHHHTDS